MAKFKFLVFLDGYENDTRIKGKSSNTKRFFCRSYSGAVTANPTSLFAKSVKLGNRLTEKLAYTAANAYGIGLMLFGLITFILYFINDYFSVLSVDKSYSVLIGLISALVSVPLLFSDKPVATAVQSRRVIDFILYEFLCIKRPHITENAKPIPTAIIAVLGALLGLLGCFVPSWVIVVVIVSVVVVYTTLLSPECTFILSLMALPFFSLVPHADAVFAVLVALTVVSFIRKVICGKRVVFFEQYDFFIILMLLTILVSRIFTEGGESFFNSVLMITTALGYTLSSNLITNRRLADCALNAVVISSIPSAVYSVYVLIFTLAEGKGAGLLGEGISSTFKTTDAYALFLLAAIIICMALAKQAVGAVRGLYVGILLLNLFALALTFEFFALIALPLAAIGYFCIKSRTFLSPALILLAAAPYLVLLLPDKFEGVFLSYIPSMSGVSGLASLWQAALGAFSENVFLGTGMGEESFVREMANYGVYGATSSKNTFIELGLEVGILAVIFFAVLLLIRMRHRASYNSYIKQSQVSTLVPFISAVLLAFICYGATDYIWSDNLSFYLFWCVFGMGSAMLRIAKKETLDRVLYYEDTRDVDYSAIDIDIR